MSVEVNVPGEYQGMIMTQLSKRNGIINGSEGAEGWVTIYAEVPLNEMFGYIGELRSTTQGRGEYSMEYCRYSPCPIEVQEKLIEEYQRLQGIVPEASKKKKKN